MIATKALKSHNSVSFLRLGVVAYLLLTVVVVAVTLGDSLRTTLHNQILFLGVLTLAIRMLGATNGRSRSITSDPAASERVWSQAYRIWRLAALVALIVGLAAEMIATLAHWHTNETLLLECLLIPGTVLFLITPDLLHLWNA